MGSDPDASLIELIMEIAETIVEPGAFDRDPEVLQAELEELLVGQRGPGKLLTWHDSLETSKGWRLHGVMAGMWRQPHACVRTSTIRGQAGAMQPSRGGAARSKAKHRQCLASSRWRRPTTVRPAYV